MIRPDITLTNSQRTCIITCKEEFTYDPYLPEKRSYVKQSNKAVFIQREVPNFLMGKIKFKGKVNKDTAECLYNLHRDCETTELKGQYGEVLGVDFKLDKFKYYKEHAEIEGQMTVLCEIEPIKSQCDGTDFVSENIIVEDLSDEDDPAADQEDNLENEFLDPENPPQE